MALPNPYANPFAKPPTTGQAPQPGYDVPVTTPMTNKTDISMSDTNPKTTDSQPQPQQPPTSKDTKLSARQLKFEKFKKLQKEKQENPRPTKPKPTRFSVKRSKAEKRRLRKMRVQRSKFKSFAKRNANRTNDNDEDNDQKKEDFILLHQPMSDPNANTKSNAKNSDKSLEPIEENKNDFNALNIDKLSLNSNASNSTKNASNASSKDKDKNHNKIAQVTIHNAVYRSVRVPQYRMVHVHRLWKEICDPIIRFLKLQIRMNSKKNTVELRQLENVLENDPKLKGKNAIQKGSDFIRAVVIGFEIKDALALVRMNDIFLEEFDVRDVKFFNKKSDHWMRAIGRIAGQYGKIKYSIENCTNTRIVVAAFKVHILGSFVSIRLARNFISRLIIGSAPGNVYAKLRVVSSRMKHSF